MFVFEPTSRWPSVSRAVVIVGCAWLALAATAVLLRSTGPADAPSLCLFRAVTGVPCPACGTSRAALAISRGDPLTALALNPLVVIGGAIALFVLALRVGFGRRIRFTRQPRSASIVIITLVIVALVLANWAYVVWRERPVG